MSDFLEQNRLSTDTCAMMSKELQNQAMNMYTMYGTMECDNTQILEFTARNPNLHYRDGVGNANACVIDEDSELRLNSRLTNLREKDQLCTRWYQAGPNIGKGGLIANVESRLILSDDTSQTYCQDVLAERNFDRFVPMLGCLKTAVQNPDNVIAPFQRAGEMTRDFVKDDAYLKKCGFVNDGKTWRRAT